jgi:hypothetical protein
MAEVETYQTVWKRYLPVIAMKIKEATRKNQPASFNLYRQEFQVAAKKKKDIPLEFTLEMKNGRCSQFYRDASFSKRFVGSAEAKSNDE